MTHDYQLFVVLEPGSQVLNRTAAGRDAGQLTPVGGFSSSWGAPTVRDHATAGAHSLTLEGSPAACEAVTLGARLEVNCLVDAQETVNLVVSWVTSVTRQVLPDGRYRLHLDLEDAIARAAGTQLAASPWPGHTQAERLAAINAASPVGWLVDAGTANGNAYAMPRDVDNADALAVIQATVAPERVTTRWPGLKRLPLPGNFYVPAVDTGPGPDDYSPARINAAGYRIVDVTADQLGDPARVLSRSSYVSHLRYSTKLWAYPNATAGDDVTVTRTAPNPDGWPSSVWEVTTDQGLANGGSALPEAAAWVATTPVAPSWLLEPARLFLDALATDDVLHILNADSHLATVLRIADPPADVDPLQVVIAGDLAGDYGRRAGAHPGAALDQLALDVTLQPAALAGARPMIWDDFPSAVAPTPATFRKQGTLTLGDLALITVR